MGASLFLSYSRADEGFAVKLAERLQRDGVGLPLLNLRTQPGQYWSDHLRDALRDSDAVVVLLSDASTNSATVMTEFGAALSIGKRIVALKMDPGPLPFSVAMSNVRIIPVAGLSIDEISEAIQHALA